MRVYRQARTVYVARRLLIVTEFFRVDTISAFDKERILRGNHSYTPNLVSSWASIIFKNYKPGARYQ